MTTLKAETVQVQGLPTRVLRRGRRGAPAALFVHGATPGVTPYCGGAHLWGGVLDRFAEERQVVVPDLPGSGGTGLPSGAFAFDALVAHVDALIGALELRDVHLVGHDLGGLIGLVLAMDKPERLASVSVVASAMSAPQGDSLDDLVFQSPPPPRWSRGSQAWALERVSYSHFPLDAALLDACTAAAEGPAHRAAVEAMAGDGYGRRFVPSMTRAKMRLWEKARTDGIAVPVQLVWGSHDPTTSEERGAVLFATLAARQTAVHYHLINRAGNLPFRDQPEMFHHVVAAFQDGVIEHRSAAA
jgi:pimeloyl-ACP methyl ester carboxylesterase